MANIGIKCLTYAKYKSGGEGGAVQYEGGKQKPDFMAKADLTVNRSNTKEYGDDHQIDSENGATGVDLALELTNVDKDIEVDMLGEEAAEGGDQSVTDAEAPFMGAGFIMKKRFRGKSTYDAYWIYKTQFTRGTVTAETRKENTTFGHETISGTASGVILADDGKVHYYTHKPDIATEKEGSEWLKKKAGISAAV